MFDRNLPTSVYSNLYQRDRKWNGIFSSHFIYLDGIPLASADSVQSEFYAPEAHIMYLIVVSWFPISFEMGGSGPLNMGPETSLVGSFA